MNPFPGLRPYEKSDAAYFFGREAQVDELISILESERFVAVTGVSGSGKSSLIHAGLIPALKEGLLSTPQPRWCIAHMRPGAGPLANLMSELDRLEINVEGLRAEIGHGARLSEKALVNAVGSTWQQDPTFAFFLLVDQFEEIFRYARENSDEADNFIELLLETTRQRSVPIYIVLTMRADFLGHCARFRGLPELINRSHFLIPRMTPEDLTRSIQNPAKMEGVLFSTQLVERLRNETGDDPERLPLLQHALQQTWEAMEKKGRSGPVDEADYEAAGTIDGIGSKGALCRHADTLYQSLASDQQCIAQTLFRCITERSREGKYLRRPCRLDRIARILFASKDAGVDWEATSEQIAALQDVIRVFADPAAFFLRPSKDTLDLDCVIDISHETIIRRWETLRSWADEDSKDAKDWQLLVEKELRWQTEGELLNDMGIAATRDLMARRQRDIRGPGIIYFFNRFWVELISGTPDPAEYDRVLLFLGRSIEEDLKTKLLKERTKEAKEKAKAAKEQQEPTTLPPVRSPRDQRAAEDYRPLPLLQRPVLSIQTVYFHESDRDDARRLGSDLYELLTRTPEDPLGYGPGIPVLAGVAASQVNLEVAETVVIIPVLGKTSYQLMADEVLETLAAWHDPKHPGKVLPVPSSANWRSKEARLPGKLLLTMLYTKDDPRQRTVDEIVLAASRLLDREEQSVQIFVSHAKADLAATDEAARKIHSFVVSDTTGRAFFDANDLHAGESLSGQLDAAVSRGVFVAVRGDAYSARVWCQRELLLAKLHGLPTLSVEILRRGERRSSPYGGNSPSVVWDGNPARIVTQAMVEWLRSEYFRREAKRISEAAGLPVDVSIVAKPPELLDLAQGPLQSNHAQIVLHPDPELSVLERKVLKSARPRLHLATPSTAFRRLLSRANEIAEGSCPLEGMQVAMSLSDSPDADGPEGFTSHHVVDASVYVARALISCGAAIAYGGDFRLGGYTSLLAELIETYNQGATRTAQDLHSYLAAHIRLSEAPDDISIRINHLKESPAFARKVLLPDPALPDAPPPALYFSDMRRVMENHVSSRIVLGGAANPKTEEGGKGYGGRYPGVVEEAWRSLEKRNPLYVVGGFGGAAAMVADLLEGQDIPKRLRDETWMVFDLYRKNAAVLDAHPMRAKLGLPKQMEDLAGAIVELAKPLLKNDSSSLAWNGLSVAENRLLFRTRDPVSLAALISKGLLNLARQRSQGTLRIELVHGSLIEAERLDAVAIATVEGVPLGGAGAALDQAAAGVVSASLAQGHTLVSLRDAPVDADWLILGSLGKLGDPAGLPAEIERVATETLDTADRHGFQRIGVVTFGGNLLADTAAVAGAMLRGFSNSSGRPALIWHETDEDRFRRLCDIMAKEPGVTLTTRRSISALAREPGKPEPIMLHVRLEGGMLSATCLPPSSSAVVTRQLSEFPAAELDRLAIGEGPRKRGTPSLATLTRRGEELATRLFGERAADFLSLCKGSPMIVLHDTGSSKVPFELLLGAPDARPALAGGITRRLEVGGLDLSRQFARPPKQGKLKVLLISNPTQDLQGAAKEAQAVKAILRQSDRVDLELLSGNEATVEQVSAALRQADILHYCGHAFFDGRGPDESGIVLAGDVPFTGRDLAKIDPLPRMAFVNACEAGRVRGAPPTEAAAFAELFLHSGMDAYLGTFWEVGDDAAALFATTVYTRLATGDTLEQATLAGRNTLFHAKEPDWANYMLFGGGGFKLVVPERPR